MPSLDRIRRSFAAHEPLLLAAEGKGRAAVAVVLRGDPGRPELLFIERARREGDPWSGHMAFPGGHIEPDDESARRAAERETHEEVGVSLGDAERLGRLDDMQGHHVAGVPGLVISAFVYYVAKPVKLVPNHEVCQAFWFPIASLLEDERHVEHATAQVAGVRFPGIQVGEPGRHVVWGLTYRFLEEFLRIVGRPLPDRWEEFRADSRT
jgi:8-oxo-dGTP pyrophosphatase MutT (NUDIX family)